MLDKKYTIAIGFTTWYVLFNIMYFTGTALESPCEKTPLLRFRYCTDTVSLDEHALRVEYIRIWNI